MIQQGVTRKSLRNSLAVNSTQDTYKLKRQISSTQLPGDVTICMCNERNNKTQ